jgi:hypothetical protein
MGRVGSVGRDKLVREDAENVWISSLWEGLVL